MTRSTLAPRAQSAAGLCGDPFGRSRNWGAVVPIIQTVAVSYGPPVGGGSVTAPIYAHLNAVAKTNGANAPYCLPNEYICAELGRAIRLPIPPYAVIKGPAAGQLMFASLDFNLTAGTALPPVDRTRCISELPFLSAGLLLFDIWITNSDRHLKNFAVDFGQTPPTMSVFDHSHALLGKDATKAEDRLTSVRDRLGVSQGSITGGNRHVLLDVIPGDDDFDVWHTRIRAVQDFFIDDVCDGAVELGLTAPEASAAKAFLKHRRDSLRTIVRAHKAEFKAITTWRLWT